MPEFKYRAIDSQGKIVTGILTGNDIWAVKQNIKSEGLSPVEIVPNKRLFSAFARSPLIFKREISGRALSHFCRQLSVIVRSGINILDGLEILARQTPEKSLRAEINRIYREVQKGRTISEAMNDPASRIPKLLKGMVATGEASGTLDEVLQSMSDFYEREHRIKQKIKSASVYPTVMAVMAAGLIAFFFNFLLPQLATLIISSGGQLPLLTRIVIAVSDFTTRYFLLILASLSGLALSLKLYFNTPKGRLNRDKLISRIPLLGSTLRHVATMRFARTGCILIKSGLPLLEGLEYIKQNVNNALAETAVDYAIDGLQRGEPLAANLARANYFDPLVIHMFSIGEQTGELEQILEEMADYYEKESDAGFTKLLAMVEPLMLVVIGGIVSTIIISVMLPMLDLVSHIKRY